MDFSIQLQESVCEAIEVLYQKKVELGSIPISFTKKEHVGDFTITVFAFAKLAGRTPEQAGSEIGEWLLKNKSSFVKQFNVIKGFLNLELPDSFWLDYLEGSKVEDAISEEKSASKVMVEYSSPNTNKPLHLGHIRNNLLGHSISEILKAVGHDVIKVNLVNDRGVHICKSMLAWQRWGNGESPESANMKGDKLVGKYYVLFDKQLKIQIAELKAKGVTEDDAEKQTELMQSVQKMLQDWEAGDNATRDLWSKMNAWVYAGFEETYSKMGVEFDKIYYESETYLLGKKIVEEGLAKNVFLKKDDGSVWADLSQFGLEPKVLQRKDGTSLYITQDIGTAKLRHDEFSPERMIYIVGNEQDHQFKVLKAIMELLEWPWAKGVFHHSYGMVDLPTGKMKSREGTVVDADDLIDGMLEEAEKLTNELGKTDGLGDEETKELYSTLGLGALKYFILKVDPKRRMLFNPQESIDFNGDTGPFIQYTYARIESLHRKGKAEGLLLLNQRKGWVLHEKERELIKIIYRFRQVLMESAADLNPSVIAHYVFELSKTFNSFYHELSVLKEENKELASFRLRLSIRTGETIKESMRLLGIQVPERM